jgi:hypothetical protein
MRISFVLMSRGAIRVARFSWYNIPKQGRMYQITIKLTNGKTIQNGHKIYLHFSFQGPPKYMCPNLDFLFENKPSGNLGFSINKVYFMKWLLGLCRAKPNCMYIPTFTDCHNVKKNENVEFPDSPPYVGMG